MTNKHSRRLKLLDFVCSLGVEAAKVKNMTRDEFEAYLKSGRARIEKEMAEIARIEKEMALLATRWSK